MYLNYNFYFTVLFIKKKNAGTRFKVVCQLQIIMFIRDTYVTVIYS